jgi:hypothetical protein
VDFVVKAGRRVLAIEVKSGVGASSRARHGRSSTTQVARRRRRNPCRVPHPARRALAKAQIEGRRGTPRPSPTCRRPPRRRDETQRVAMTACICAVSTYCESSKACHPESRT